jgi:hypothetical protein
VCPVTEQKGERIMSKEQAGKNRAEEAFAALANGTVDAPSLLKFGEKAVREALQAIAAFKKDQMDRIEKEKEREAVIEQMLVAAGLISPVIDVTAIRGVKSGSVNAQYAALALRANGATWEELQAVTDREAVTRSKKLKGLKAFIGNFSKHFKGHDYTVSYDSKGVKMTDSKK